jgi:hypothetical protein
MINVRGLVVVINATNFFCFICVFFRGGKEWSFDGISTIKNIGNKKSRKTCYFENILEKSKTISSIGKNSY